MAPPDNNGMPTHSDPETAIHAVKDFMLFMRWMYDLPTWLLGLLVVGLFVGLTLLGLRFFHSRLHRSALATLIDNGTVGWFFSGISLLYGLTLGLLTVATWGNFTESAAIASQEAASIAALYRDLAGYPVGQQAVLKAELRDYTRFIIEKSWAAQRQGKINDNENLVLETFQNDLLTTDLANNEHQALHAEALRMFNNMVELRRQRIESIGGSVPGVLWSVVLLGALATLGSSFLFSVQNFGLHAAMAGLLAAMVGLLIFLIIALDHPYWGEVSVTPEAYQRVLSNVMVR
ncbi:DUF4239 domain-containing protein [Hymenobacter sp. GOD-10R]|uniref:bestrophin-like domain n=1 Tax=Hymenobacter sp. GOD-10R TaxID=3093922 RepID=UPI002D795D8C|nr:DUF4239 domain-containing protein [Hymenobacter sp. GOD-10R]WRQ30946.1 DUF4239 domain-containing protein [Hymenobacter sp. GOD-10R]